MKKKEDTPFKAKNPENHTLSGRTSPYSKGQIREYPPGVQDIAQ